MAVIYVGYNRECDAWAKGKVDAWTRTYAASIVYGGNTASVAAKTADEAVKKYILHFPKPVFPEDEDF